MTNEHLIPAREYCMLHSVEMSFLNSLAESGLLQVHTIGTDVYIDHDQLPGLEKWERLHYDMQINIEGLEAIQHLLDQIQFMQTEMKRQRDKLEIYETSGLEL